MINPSHLRALRVAMKFTQKELAQELGLVENTIWRMEHGQLKVAERTERALRSLAKLRGVWQ